MPRLDAKPVSPPISATTPTSELPELLTIDELQTVARLGRAATYALVGSGAIPSVKFGKSIRIPKSVLSGLPKVPK